MADDQRTSCTTTTSNSPTTGRRRPPVEVQVVQLIESFEELYDGRIAKVDINCLANGGINVSCLLRPELLNINVTFAIN